MIPAMNFHLKATCENHISRVLFMYMTSGGHVGIDWSVTNIGFEFIMDSSISSIGWLKICRKKKPINL